MSMEKNAHLLNRAFYRGKRVFVTGHTGYKGSWLTAILYELGAEATGYALAPPEGGLFRQMGGETMIRSVIGDVSDRESLEAALLAAQPEIVFHLAALVTECFAEPRRAYESNVMGTVDLFEAIRKCPSVKSVVIVTTDKVYANKGDGAVYAETDPLGGVDPYDASKTCMEYITDSYKRAYLQRDGRMVGVSTARASNVLGGGDHVKTRLIPTILNAIAEGRPVELRHPNQTRPWQSMLDALNGYLAIGRLMYEEPERYSSQWNIGPTRDGIRSVLWVVEQMQKHYASTWYVADAAQLRPESEMLGLDISKSLALLDWEPRLSCDEMFYNVVDFFKKQQEGVDPRAICAGQIRKFYGMEGV